jgi:hypothetical protein
MLTISNIMNNQNQANKKCVTTTNTHKGNTNTHKGNTNTHKVNNNGKKQFKTLTKTIKECDTIENAVKSIIKKNTINQIITGLTTNNGKAKIFFESSPSFFPDSDTDIEEKKKLGVALYSEFNNQMSEASNYGWRFWIDVEKRSIEISMRYTEEKHFPPITPITAITAITPIIPI